MSWGTATTGPKSQRIPVAFISRAVAVQTCWTSAGSCVAPRPTFCGNIVAHSTLLWPWTASTPYRIGMPRRVPRAASWYALTMSYQACGVFGSGKPPPPLRIEPRLNAAAFLASIAFFSIWVIWPIFSSRVIWPSRAATRSPTGLPASSHGRPDDGDPDAAWLEEAIEVPGVPVAGGLPQAATTTATATAAAARPRPVSLVRGRPARPGYAICLTAAPREIEVCVRSPRSPAAAGTWRLGTDRPADTPPES